MHIEELKIGELENGEQGWVTDVSRSGIAVSDARSSLVGVGARFLFYPTLLYNVVRNKIQSEFRWWDRVDEFILLGAVPFPTDVPRLKQLGVSGVITLNEPYETLVPTSLYRAHGIQHLVIPTRDYLFAPSFGDICQAVEFIHKNASCGKTTYVHCKAGRGRSTTIVLCYLVQHKQMTPDAAYEYVKSIRPRVLLAAAQWGAVQEYYHYWATRTGDTSFLYNPIVKALAFPAAAKDLLSFDDGSVVIVTKADLDGYDPTCDSHIVGNEVWAELSLVYRIQFAGQGVLGRLSCLWLHCHTRQKISDEKPSRESSCSVEADKLRRVGVDINVY